MSDYSTISIRHNFPEIAAKLDRLGNDIGDKAVTRALNTTVRQGQTQMARQISREFKVPVGKAKERLVIHRAYYKRGVYHFQAKLEATRRGRGRSMNLIHFVENKTTLAEGRKRAKKGTLNQVHFQIKRTGGKKVIPGAFIANRGRTVFIRTGKKRLPIRAVNTIDIPQMFNAKRIHGAVGATIIAKFPQNFRRELRAVLGGFAK